MAITTVKLLGLVQFINIFVVHTYGNDYTWSNELKSTKGYTEWSGGIVANHHRLRADESPYFVLNNVVVEDTGQLIIDPGVTLKFSPKTGITVKGSIVANVMTLIVFFFFLICTYKLTYFNFRETHIIKLL